MATMLRKQGDLRMDETPLSDFDEERIAARELHKVCIHEAGHKVVLRALGGDADCFVWRNSPERLAAGERAWRGSLRVRVTPGLYGEAAANWREMAGLAGMVAEEICDGESDPEEIALEIWSRLDFDEVSATDSELMGTGWEPHVAATVQVLKEQWEQVLMWARYAREDAHKYEGDPNRPPAYR